MSKRWLFCIFGTSFFLLAVLKTHELSSLKPFYIHSKSIKLQSFNNVKPTLNPSEQELLELWESMLTGRSAPLSRWMKERYQILGLNHLFTPSGFHLSAVLVPFMKLLKSIKAQIIVLMIIGLCLVFVPGQGALKRMVSVKIQQRFFGIKTGFILALITDCLFGSFQNASLSFSYSFLFLGIIYSGIKGLSLVMWFFLAQVVLSYFQGNNLSPLIIILSPLLNFSFGLAMPLLFALALPLWNWQVFIGLKILAALQFLVDKSALLTSSLPSWEINIGMIFFFIFLLTHRWKSCIFCLLILSHNLNVDKAKLPSLGSNEYVPSGDVIKIFILADKDLVYYENGKCERKLVRGIWWEKCSPSRSKTRRRNFKFKSKKLSYPS